MLLNNSYNIKNSVSVPLYLRICFLLFFAIALIQAKTDELPLKPTKVIDFTTDEGTWINLDVSSDGNFVVFDLLGDLYLLAIGEKQAKQITSGMAYDTQPRFSPDDKKIVFLSDRSGSENIWVLEFNQALNTKTFDKNIISFRTITKDNDASYSSPDWSFDGQYIVVSRTPRFTWIDVNHNLWIYHIDGGRGTPLLDNGEPIFALGPVFAPNTDKLYFSNRHPDDNEAFGHQIESYNLITGSRRKITNQAGGAIRPAISADGRWMVYGSRYDGKTGYRLRSLIDGTEKWLTFPVQPDQQENNWMGTSSDHLPGFSFSPDNKFIIAAIDGKINKVSIYNGDRTEIPFQANVSLKIKPVIHHDKKVSDGSVELRQIRYPSLSPNGEDILFTALNRIYKMQLSSNKIKKLVDLDDRQFYPSWSPNSKYISFVTWDDYTGGNLYIIKPDGKSLTKLTTETGYFKELVWSPNNKELAVIMGSWHQPGENLSIGLINIEEKRIKILKEINGGGLHFTSDPNRIYYNDYNHQTIRRHHPQ